MSTIADLIVAKTKAVLYTGWLATATALGVPVTSWEVGDPTDSLAQWVTEEIAALELVFVDFCKSAFLDYAAADSTLYEWLVIVADQQFGYTARTATYASCTYRLSNTTGAIYSFDPGDITVKNTLTGATYHNTQAGTLLGGTPSATAILDLAIEADLPGSGSSAIIGEIVDLLTPFGDVTGVNTTAAIGQDAEPAASIVLACRNKLARMTNGGPRDAYVSVALDSTLTGTTVPTRARATSDSLTGVVSVYLASDSGAVPAPDLAKVQTALTEWAAPLCITPIAVSATACAVAFEYDVVLNSEWGTTDVEAHAEIYLAIQKWVASVPIGGYPGLPGITDKMVEQAISGTSKYVVEATARIDTGTAMTANQVITISSVDYSAPVWVAI